MEPIVPTRSLLVFRMFVEQFVDHSTTRFLVSFVQLTLCWGAAPPPLPPQLLYIFSLIFKLIMFPIFSLYLNEIWLPNNNGNSIWAFVRWMNKKLFLYEVQMEIGHFNTHFVLHNNGYPIIVVHFSSDRITLCLFYFTWITLYFPDDYKQTWEQFTILLPPCFY